MLFWDRYWPLKLLGAPLAAALAVAAPWWYLATVLPMDHAQGWPVAPDQWFAAGLATALALAAISLFVSAVRGRARMLRRRLAIAGQLDAVPLSSVETDPAAAPQVSDESLALLWRASGFDRAYAGCFLIFVGGVCALFGIGFFVASLAWIMNGNARWMIREAGTPKGLMVAAVLGCSASGVWILRMAIPALLGRRVGVVASEDGITLRPLWGRQRTMAWREVRLFEVAMSDWKAKRQSPRYILLHSQRTTLRWREDWEVGTIQQMDVFKPEGIKRSEMHRRQLSLLDLIAARTGLQPRTFSRRLGAHVESPRQRWLRGMAYGLMGALLFGAMAGLVMGIPLSSLAWLNAAIAVTVGGLAILSLYRAIRALRDLLHPIVSDPTFAYAQHTPIPAAGPEAEAMYVMWRERRWWQSALAVAAGLPLCLNFVPVLALWQPGLFRWLQPEGPLIGAGLPPVLAFALLLPAIAGPLLILQAVVMRRTLYWANAEGVGFGYPFYTIEIPWSQVTGIVAETRHGQPRRYTVLGRSGTPPVTFPAEAQTFDDVAESQRRITPAELAEFVSQRAGVPIARWG